MSKNGAVTVKLSYPIELGSEKISEITVQRPLGRDLRGLSSSPTMGDIMTIAASCSGQPDEAFDKMAASDVMKVTQVVNDFLDVGP